jgi:hypothetical protein
VYTPAALIAPHPDASSTDQLTTTAGVTPKVCAAPTVTSAASGDIARFAGDPPPGGGDADGGGFVAGVVGVPPDVCVAVAGAEPPHAPSKTHIRPPTNTNAKRTRRSSMAPPANFRREMASPSDRAPNFLMN